MSYICLNFEQNLKHIYTSLKYLTKIEKLINEFQKVKASGDIAKKEEFYVKIDESLKVGDKFILKEYYC
jgi:hypothetical protein